MRYPITRGKTALITGISKGIGLAIGLRLLQAGINVVGLARSKGQADKLEAQAMQPGSGAFRLEFCDVTDGSAVTSLIAALQREGVAVDVLVNNAGIALGAPDTFWDQSPETIQKVASVNMLGLVNVTHAALRTFLIPAGKGTILTISSVTGLEVPHKGMGEVIYHSTKAFTEGFVNALRNELLGTDIRALVLRPGFVRTNFHFDRTGQDDKSFEDVFEGVEELQAGDVADAAAYMLSLPERMSVKALDLVPTAQRSLAQVDRQWSARHPKPEAPAVSSEAQNREVAE